MKVFLRIFNCEWTSVPSLSHLLFNPVCTFTTFISNFFPGWRIVRHFSLWATDRTFFCAHNTWPAYLIFVIFLLRQNFWRIKFTPKTPIFANFLRYIWKKLHRPKRIYTGAARGARDKYEVWSGWLLWKCFPRVQGTWGRVRASPWVVFFLQHW